MASRTISLEASAYEKLRLAKQNGESFTDTINRILKDSQPSFSRLAGVLSRTEASRVREAVQQMRELEQRAERGLPSIRRRGSRGRNSRH